MSAENLLTLKYVPISHANLFESNAKLHNLDDLIASFKKYGFKSAAKWEGKLNKGKGAIVAGNGRVEALRLMFDRGEEVPEGIAVDSNGEWCVPVLFGVEAKNETLARAYALDDNNLTFGGNFDSFELEKLYDPEILLQELEALSLANQMPLTVSDEDLSAMLKKLSGQSDEEDTEMLEPGDSSTKQLNTDYDLGNKCPKCGFEF